MLEPVKRFESIISSFNILVYEKEGTSSRLKLEVVFNDQSKLLIRVISLMKMSVNTSFTGWIKTTI